MCPGVSRRLASKLALAAPQVTMTMCWRSYPIPAWH
jgi:hypothetical protein